MGSGYSLNGAEKAHDAAAPRPTVTGGHQRPGHQRLGADRGDEIQMRDEQAAELQGH